MSKTVALLSAGLLVASVACGRNEPNYEDAANKALDQAKLDAVDADYDTKDRVVHVTGTVQSEVDRQRAGDVVQQAVADRAQVANEVTVAGGHELTADDFDGGIETRLRNMVELDPAWNELNIEFDANNGIVTITGRVPTASEKERVGQMTAKESGVRDVVNSLEVGAAKSK